MLIRRWKYGESADPFANRWPSGSVDAVSRLKAVRLYGGSVIVSANALAKLTQDVVAALSQTMPVVIFPSTLPNTVSIGLQKADFARAFNALSARSGVTWRIKNRPVKVRNFSELRILSDAGAISAFVEVLRGLHLCFRFSLFEPVEGVLTSKDDTNQVARKLSRDMAQAFFSSPGVKLASEVMGVSAAGGYDFPIDAVYTWVNHEDAGWKEMFAKHSPKERLSGDAAAHSRFLSRNELLYSIRSVQQYMPWIRNVFVLTNCAPPDWFVPDKGVIWIDHAAVLKDVSLPTFSSHAIETSLHHIPGLSENFLYFNDDFFVNAPASPALFFEPSGLSKSKLEGYGVVNGEFAPEDPDYLNAARLGASLLAKRFGTAPTRLHEHTPYALRVSVLKDIEQAFAEQLKITRANRFRAAGDLSIASFFYHHYAMATGAAVATAYNALLVKNSNPRLIKTITSLVELTGPRVFCLNDGNDSHDDTDWDSAIRSFLEYRYPHACRFEPAGTIGPQS